MMHHSMHNYKCRQISKSLKVHESSQIPIKKGQNKQRNKNSINKNWGKYLSSKLRETNHKSQLKDKIIKRILSFPRRS